MKNNILIGLSGGPSVAINSSLAGILHAAANSDSFDKIYGAKHGIEGLMNSDIIDLFPYCSEKSLALLRQTPAMALGSCRKKLSEKDFPVIDDVVRRYHINVFFYIGGNDSMDTVLKLNQHFQKTGMEIRVIGVPKTIDNDLPVTDHSPGFGSAAKYVYHTMSEIIRDSKIYPVKNVVIVELMGRNSGWLTLAGALPHFLKGGAPQIIAIPEVPFDSYEFIESVKQVLKTDRTVICAVSEGIKDKNGEYIGTDTKSGVCDTFGHTYLSGVGKYLEFLVREKIGCKVRSIELNVMQRCSSHLASKTDLDEAFQIGEAAVQCALDGETGKTMIYKRTCNSPYQIKIETTDVSNIANLARDIPKKWHCLSDKNVQKEIVQYMLPLMQGDINEIKDETGLPIYIDIV